MDKLEFKEMPVHLKSNVPINPCTVDGFIKEDPDKKFVITVDDDKNINVEVDGKNGNIYIPELFYNIPEPDMYRTFKTTKPMFPGYFKAKYKGVPCTLVKFEVNFRIDNCAHSDIYNSKALDLTALEWKYTDFKSY